MSVRARESGHPVFNALGPRVRGDERSFTETARSKTLTRSAPNATAARGRSRRWSNDALDLVESVVLAVDR